MQPVRSFTCIIASCAHLLAQFVILTRPIYLIDVELFLNKPYPLPFTVFLWYFIEATKKDGIENSINLSSSTSNRLRPHWAMYERGRRVPCINVRFRFALASLSRIRIVNARHAKLHVQTFKYCFIFSASCICFTYLQDSKLVSARTVRPK